MYELAALVGRTSKFSYRYCLPSSTFSWQLLILFCIQSNSRKPLTLESVREIRLPRVHYIRALGEKRPENLQPKKGRHLGIMKLSVKSGKYPQLLILFGDIPIC